MVGICRVKCKKKIKVAGRLCSFVLELHLSALVTCWLTVKSFSYFLANRTCCIVIKSISLVNAC